MIRRPPDPGPGRRLLVVGYGMVADRLLDELDVRGALDRFDVTVVGEERQAAYNRILLSHVLAGGDPASLAYRSGSWAEEVGIRQIRGRWVQRLDVARKVAVIGDHEEVGYDVAVLTTGSAPIVPPISGVHVGGGLGAGVHVYRTLDDCLALRRSVHPGDDVVVVGGGLLGLEAADVLARAGAHVTIVHPTPTLLDVQLDEVAGGMLRQAFVDRGISVVVGRAQAALRSGDGLDAVRLEDGRVLGADHLVLTTGVRPRTEAASSSGIAVERGIVVDDTLATSAPGVYALGDCAEHRGVCNGLVFAGWEQAAVLAARLAGDRVTYTGAARATRLKVAGIEVAAMGVRDPGPEDEVVTVSERLRGSAPGTGAVRSGSGAGAVRSAPGAGAVRSGSGTGAVRSVYRRLIIRDGRLAGAIVYGDPDGAADLIGLYDRGEPLPERPLDVFCSAGAFRGSGTVATVCSCNQVDEASIATAIEDGAGSVEEVGARTRAGTGCGTCRSRIGELVAELAPAPVS